MKKKLSKIYSFLLSFIKHPKEFLIFLKSIRDERVYENIYHIKLAAEWLLLAQEVGDDNGYSRGFYLQKRGWDKSYIETTGYIIPTMIALYKKYNDDSYKDSAMKAGEWLLSVQNLNGSFSDIDNDVELVFDTGQVLYGFISLYESDLINDTQKKRYLNAIEKASFWLVEVLDSDGSWSRYGYQNMGHTYYSRVASILYKSGIICQKDEFKSASTKHINWVLNNQLSNGFFQKLEFVKDEKPLLHAIIYVLEGLYEYYKMSGDKRVYKALIKNSQKLKEININRDLLLCSQYSEDFSCVNSQRCMTGLAQWANISFKLYRETRDEEYLLCAKKSLYYLKAKQFKEHKDLKGAFSGSVPFWGYYAPFSATNWGVKFFIDAMLEYSKFESDLITQSNEWIGECFKFSSKVISSEFSDTAKNYIKYLTSYIQQSKKILDLGCGEGKYIRYFKNEFPSKEFFGIDPYFYDDMFIKKGDVYRLDKSNKYDLVYLIEVLQHVKYLDISLDHIYDIVNDNGYLIICERDPNGSSSLVKKWYEFRGKWMYPWDTPFSEKWYSNIEWINILEKRGFIVEKIIPIKSKVGKKSGMNRFFMIVCKKNKRYKSYE